MDLVTFGPVAFEEMFETGKLLESKNELDNLYSEIFIYLLRQLSFLIFYAKIFKTFQKSYVLAFSHIRLGSKKVKDIM